jgi:GDP-4-dehydro-6-deoxy-D-mannose reductase
LREEKHVFEVMKKVLVLGHRGFTGRHFTEFIIKKNLHQDYLFIGYDTTKCEDLPFNSKILDLSLPNNIHNMLVEEQPDYIMNFIGKYSTEIFTDLVNLNFNIPSEILLTCLKEKINVKKILLIGSAAEYGNCSILPISENEHLTPVSIYGFSKELQTRAAIYFFQKHNINVSIARPFNLLGKGLPSSLSAGSFVEKIKSAKDDRDIEVGNIYSRRDFIDVSDAVDGYWKILLYGNPGEVYNVCSGHSIQIIDLLNGLIKLSGKNINVVVGSKLIKSNDIPDSYGDNSKLKSLNNWSIEKSLQDSLINML